MGLVVVSEIEEVVKTSPIAVGGVTVDDNWYSAYTALGTWYRVRENYWQTVLLIQPLNNTKLIIPKVVVVAQDQQDWALYRLVRSPIYGVYADGQANWITAPSGNVRFTQGHRNWQIQTTGDELNASDIIPPDAANSYTKLQVTIPFDEELNYTAEGEYLALIGRKMGKDANMFGSVTWIERAVTP